MAALTKRRKAAREKIDSTKAYAIDEALFDDDHRIVRVPIGVGEQAATNGPGLRHVEVAGTDDDLLQELDGVSVADGQLLELGGNRKAAVAGEGRGKRV